MILSSTSPSDWQPGTHAIEWEQEFSILNTSLTYSVDIFVANHCRMLSLLSCSQASFSYVL